MPSARIEIAIPISMPGSGMREHCQKVVSPRQRMLEPTSETTLRTLDDMSRGLLRDDANTRDEGQNQTGRLNFK
jgi:hypothetical protein